MKCKSCKINYAKEPYDFCINCIENKCDIEQLIPKHKLFDVETFELEKEEKMLKTREKKNDIIEFYADGEIIVFIFQVLVFIILSIITIGLLFVNLYSDDLQIGDMFFCIIPLVYMGILTLVRYSEQNEVKKGQKTDSEFERRLNIYNEAKQYENKCRREYLEEVARIYLECKKRDIRTANGEDFKLIVKNLGLDLETSKEQFKIGKLIDKRLKEEYKKIGLEKELEPYYNNQLKRLNSLIPNGRMVDEKKGKEYIDKIEIKAASIKKLEFGSEYVVFETKLPKIKIFKKEGKIYCKIKINMYEDDKLIGDAYLTSEMYINIRNDAVFKMNEKIKNKKNVKFEYEFLDIIVSE